MKQHILRMELPNGQWIQKPLVAPSSEEAVDRARRWYPYATCVVCIESRSLIAVATGATFSMSAKTSG